MSKPVLGIIGGGQLGSMLVTAAKKIGLKTVIFCDDQDAPAQNFCAGASLSSEKTIIFTFSFFAATVSMLHSCPPPIIPSTGFDIILFRFFFDGTTLF